MNDKYINKFLETPDDSADLWYCTFDLNRASMPHYLSLLSEHELLKAKKFKFEVDRDRFVISRGILRTLLGGYLKKNPKNIEFEYSAFGKPFVQNSYDVKFNISHSGDMAVLGFVKGVEIGVDIEKIKEDFEVLKLAKNFFSNIEIESLEKQPKEDLPSAFFRCWTRKESFIKAEGSGLSFPLDKFAVSLENDEEAELLETLWDVEEKDQWSLFSFKPSNTYIGAVAVKHKVKKISYYNWDSNQP